MKKNRHISFGFAKSATLVLLLGCSHLLADDIGTASSTFPIPKTQKSFEGLASWYFVPAHSLATAVACHSALDIRADTRNIGAYTPIGLMAQPGLSEDNDHDFSTLDRDRLTGSHPNRHLRWHPERRHRA